MRKHVCCSLLVLMILVGSSTAFVPIAPLVPLAARGGSAVVSQLISWGAQAGRGIYAAGAWAVRNRAVIADTVSKGATVAQGVGAIAQTGSQMYGLYVDKTKPAVVDEKTNQLRYDEFLSQIEDVKKTLTSKVERDELDKLAAAVKERPTLKEFHALLGNSLRRIDSEMAEQMARIDAIANQVGVLERSHARLSRKVDALEGRQEDTATRVGVIEDGIEEDRRRRENLRKQAEILNLKAFVAYRNGQYESALAIFGDAETENPLDPTSHYGQALAYRALGRTKEAERILKRGVVTELGKGNRLPKWLGIVMERIQGPERVWFSDARARLIRLNSDR